MDPCLPYALQYKVRGEKAPHCSIRSLAPPCTIHSFSHSLLFTMTLISRFLVPLALLASILPFVTAGSSDCGSDEYWYNTKSCCVPRTPPSNPSSPPPGKSCPPSGYWWFDQQSCCVPTAPPPPTNPAPTCQNGHSWDENESCCSPPSPSNCHDDEFWYGRQSCCLPYGGPPNPSSPPTGSKCPPSGYYWGDNQKCCVPYQPNPPSPQCPSGWVWSANDKCQPISTPPSSNNPQPSHNYGHGWKKVRANKL
jgi:hypothetical protein